MTSQEERQRRTGRSRKARPATRSSRPPAPDSAAGQSSVILLRPPLPLVGVSIGMERGCQQQQSVRAGRAPGLRTSRGRPATPARASTCTPRSARPSLRSSTPEGPPQTHINICQPCGVLHELVWPVKLTLEFRGGRAPLRTGPPSRAGRRLSAPPPTRSEAGARSTARPET